LDAAFYRVEVITHPRINIISDVQVGFSTSHQRQFPDKLMKKHLLGCRYLILVKGPQMALGGQSAGRGYLYPIMRLAVMLMQEINCTVCLE